MASDEASNAAGGSFDIIEFEFDEKELDLAIEDYKREKGTFYSKKHHKFMEQCISKGLNKTEAYYLLKKFDPDLKLARKTISDRYEEWKRR